MLLLDQPSYCPELALKIFISSFHCKATPETNVFLLMWRLQMRQTATLARADNAKLHFWFLKALW